MIQGTNSRITVTLKFVFLPQSEQNVTRGEIKVYLCGCGTVANKPIWVNSMLQQEPQLPGCVWAVCSCDRRPQAVHCVRGTGWTWCRLGGARSYGTSRKVPAGSPGSAGCRRRSRPGRWLGLAPISLRTENHRGVADGTRAAASLRRTRAISEWPDAIKTSVGSASLLASK